MSASPKNAWIKWTAVAVVVAILVAGALVWWSRRCPAELGPLVEITCSHQSGNLTGDYPWEMTLNADGKGDLIHNGVPRTISAPKVMQEFKTKLGELPLCDLPALIGEPLVDGGWNLITIKFTNFEKTIGFGALSPEQRSNHDLVEAQKLWLLAERAARGARTAPVGPQQ